MVDLGGNIHKFKPNKKLLPDFIYAKKDLLKYKERIKEEEE